MSKTTCASIVLLYFITIGICANHDRTSKFLGGRGLGPRCDGCPQNFCDDDPNIIQGYCCGCARYYDDLPVRCQRNLHCPANTYSLCESYEYMMYCCCNDK